MAENILILNFTRMGDLVQSSPLISGLRARHPGARITLVCGADFSEFSERLPHVDCRLAFDLRQFTGTKGTSWVRIYRYLESFLDDLADRNFDLVFNLSHSKLSALMIRYLGIPAFRGFMVNPEGDRITEHPWMQYFFTEPFNRPFNSFNLVDLFARGGDLDPKDAKLEILSAVEDEGLADRFLADWETGSEVTVALQAGSSLQGRRWPTRHFARLADRLAETWGARILLLGVAGEREEAESILNQMRFRNHARNLAGQTSIPELIGLLRRCDYLVTNDTGTMHLAAALGVRIAALFFAHAHPYETAPYAAGNVVFQADLPCAPCSYGVVCNDTVCVRQVSPETVWNAFESHRQGRGWTLPQEEEQGVRAYETEFDSEGYLKMRPLVQRPLTPEDLFRYLYRRVWKCSLGEGRSSRLTEGLLAELRADFQTEGLPGVISTWSPDAGPLFHLLGFSREGMAIAGEMAELIRTRGAYQDLLQPLVVRIGALDESIQKIGLTHPELKPLTDMFDKRKENLYGDDVLVLAENTGQAYQALHQEGVRLGELLAALAAAGKESADPQALVSSISVAAPGR